MRLEQSKQQKIKLALYAIIALCNFITWCITISIFSKSTNADGRLSWYFALCFLTIPALIYTAAVPFWSRSQRLANVYVFAALDALFVIFWLSAFASVLSWNRSGVAQGAIDKKIDKAEQQTCAIFAYGSEQACPLSYSNVGFGVVIFLLYIVETVFSVLYVRKARSPESENTTPWLAKNSDSSSQLYTRTPGGLEANSGKDNTWDDQMGDTENPFHHEDDAAADHNTTAGHTNTQADRLPNHQEEYGEHGGEQRNSYGGYEGRQGGFGYQTTETGDGRHPGRPWGTHDAERPVDTGYHGGGGGGGGASYQAPSALSPTSYSSQPGQRLPGGFDY